MTAFGGRLHTASSEPRSSMLAPRARIAGCCTYGSGSNRTAGPRWAKHSCCSHTGVVSKLVWYKRNGCRDRDCIWCVWREWRTALCTCVWCVAGRLVMEYLGPCFWRFCAAVSNDHCFFFFFFFSRVFLLFCLFFSLFWKVTYERPPSGRVDISACRVPL